MFSQVSHLLESHPFHLDREFWFNGLVKLTARQLESVVLSMNLYANNTPGISVQKYNSAKRVAEMAQWVLEIA